VSESTRLAPDRYLQLIAADGGRLAAVAEGHLEADVPTCPGWTVSDLVLHTGSVYHHKIACLQLGRRPEESEFPHGPADDQDAVDWFRDAHRQLLAELGSRPPDATTYTWYPPEQDVSFWIRRMAHESVVHRVDAESASRQVTAADDDLAVDGIDEVLDLFLSYALGQDPDEDVDAHQGRSLRVRTGSWAWQVSVGTDDPANKIPLQRTSAPAQATVSGEPSELMLWLWGRRPDSAVTVHGDTSAVAAVRDLLSRGTV
jgi:uncharacterized protein (TIGR03083 family)